MKEDYVDKKTQEVLETALIRIEKESGFVVKRTPVNKSDLQTTIGVERLHASNPFKSRLKKSKGKSKK